MTGRTGGRACSGSHSAAPDQAPVARTTWLGAQLLAGRGAHAGEPLALEQTPSTTSVPVRTSTPSARERRQQRRGQRPRVDRRLAGRVDAAVEGGRQARLQLAAAARRQPLGLEPERALQVVDAAQLRRLVAVEGDVQGAAAARSRSPSPLAASSSATNSG